MADVARLAGVSHQTVSRVLNEHPNVRPLTRDKVLAAIRELAYRPNAAARTLVTRRTHTLGVISFDTMLYGPPSMLYGFERAAHDAYFVSVASLPALDRGSMLDAVDRFLGQGIEGIIVIATQDTAVAALAHVPAGGAAGRGGLRHPRRGHVGGDRQRGRRGRGDPLPARPGAPDRLPRGRARRPAWTRRNASTAGGRRCARPGRPSLTVLAGDWSAASGYEVGCQLAADPALTAIFCGNDTMALGVIRALAERGLRVPDDVSIVGFDDVPEAGYLPAAAHHRAAGFR